MLGLPPLLPACCASRDAGERAALPTEPLPRADEPDPRGAARLQARRPRRPAAVWRLSVVASLGIHALFLALAAVLFAQAGSRIDRGPAVAHVSFEAPTEIRDEEPEKDLEIEPPDPEPPADVELIPIADVVLPEDESLEAPEEVVLAPPQASPFEVPLDAARKRLRTALRPPPEPPPPARPVARPSPPPKPRPVPPPRPQRAAPARLRVLYAPRPDDYYPHDARERGVQGTAYVVFTVSEQGHVLAAELERSSGHGSLDAAALQFVQAFRFAPPGVQRRGRLPISFLLR